VADAGLLFSEVAQAAVVHADRKTAAQSMLDLIGTRLGASGGLIAVADAEGLQLTAIAVLGTHSSLLRSMPPIDTGSASELARVFSEGEAVFAEATHAASVAEEPSDGVGRWRTGIATGSYARLPLTASAGRLGALALDWGEPRTFDQGERALLAGLAGVVAGVLEAPVATDAPEPPASDGSTAEPAAEPGPPPPPSRPARIEEASFALTSLGALLPLGGDTAGADETVAWLVTATASPRDGASRPTGLVEVFALPGERVGVLLGSMDDGSGKPLPDMIRSAVRTYGLSCSSASGTLRSAWSSIARFAPDENLSAAYFALDFRKGALAACASGEVRPLIVRGDGRVVGIGESDESHAHLEDLAFHEIHDIFLPGDTLIVASPVDPSPTAVDPSLDALVGEIRQIAADDDIAQAKTVLADAVRGGPGARLGAFAGVLALHVTQKAPFASGGPVPDQAGL
jgi:hypothetical protein